MARKIAIIQGHPDPAGGHFCHALAEAYAEGAHYGGHDVRLTEVARLDFPLLRTAQDYEKGKPPPDIAAAQEAVSWANHIVLVYPLWLGALPALLKGFLEQVFRPGYAVSWIERGHAWDKLLTGRSARVVVTMGMPAWAYRWYFRAHSLKNLERNILGFCGIGPIRETLIGSIEEIDEEARTIWLEKLRRLGEDGD